MKRHPSSDSILSSELMTIRTNSGNSGETPISGITLFNTSIPPIIANEGFVPASRKSTSFFSRLCMSHYKLPTRADYLHEIALALIHQRDSISHQMKLTQQSLVYAQARSIGPLNLKSTVLSPSMQPPVLLGSRS